MKSVQELVNEIGDYYLWMKTGQLSKNMPAILKGDSMVRITLSFHKQVTL